MIGNMVGQVTEDADLQIVPQAKAKPVRPSLTPLNGATITDFQPNGNGNGYVLTYTRNGQTFQVDYSWTSAGVYTYQFIAPNGTTTETYNEQPPCTSLVPTTDFLEKTLDVVVFPNPTTGGLTLVGLGTPPTLTPPTLVVTVFDLNGRQVFQKENPGATLEIGGLAKGIYLVKIQLEKGEITRKIVVQ